MVASAVNLTWIRCGRCHKSINLEGAEKRTHVNKIKKTTITSLPTHKRKDFSSAPYEVLDEGIHCDSCKNPINMNAGYIKKKWKKKPVYFCDEKCRKSWVAELMAK
jgi:hypothetical protein